MASRAFQVSKFGNTSLIFADTANSRIGFNTSSPTQTVDIIGVANVTTDIKVAGSSISPVQSFRNKIINGNFDYWQRQTSNTNVVTGQYVADRWINIKTGTPILNISQQLFTTGQTAVPNEPTYFYRANTVSSTGSANGMFIAQRVESARTLAGQTATLSFYAKADASKNVAVEFVQNFGTNGSAEANGVNVTTFSLTSSWQQFKTTVTLPSISGKTVDTANANFLAVNFWLDAGSTFNTRTNSLGQQSGNFDFSQVQLEAGSVATPFEIRPISTELALCQRYYNKSYDTSTNPGTSTYNGSYSGSSWYATAGVSWGSVNFIYPVTMRSVPTLTTYSTDGTVGYFFTSILNRVVVGTNIGQTKAVAYSDQFNYNDKWYIHYTASIEL